MRFCWVLITRYHKYTHINITQDKLKSYLYIYTYMVRINDPMALHWSSYVSYYQYRFNIWSDCKNTLCFMDLKIKANIFEILWRDTIIFFDSHWYDLLTIFVYKFLQNIWKHWSIWLYICLCTLQLGHFDLKYLWDYISLRYWRNTQALCGPIMARKWHILEA